MLIEFFLNMLLLLLRAFLLPFQVAELPAGVAQNFLLFVTYIADGMRVVNVYIDTAYIGALFAFVMTINALMTAYRFTMWLLRKIPFVNIK